MMPPDTRKGGPTTYLAGRPTHNNARSIVRHTHDGTPERRADHKTTRGHSAATPVTRGTQWGIS